MFCFLWFTFNIQKHLPYILANYPAGSSLLQGVHYVQLMSSGGFRKFDKKYMELKTSDRAIPREYDLTKVTTKTNIFYSNNDDTSTKVDELIKKLPNVKHIFEHSTFTHLDFVYSKSVRELNEKIVQQIKIDNNLMTVAE